MPPMPKVPTTPADFGLGRMLAAFSNAPEKISQIIPAHPNPRVSNRQPTTVYGDEDFMFPRDAVGFFSKLLHSYGVKRVLCVLP
jgi:hypothetical protein